MTATKNIFDPGFIDDLDKQPDVLVITPDGDIKEELDFKTFLARGRVADCTCDMISCVCNEIKGHKKECHFRLAQTCPFEILCEHGLDCCLECDKCTCADLPDE